jgi:hypothetical protein
MCKQMFGTMQTGCFISVFSKIKHIIHQKVSMRSKEYTTQYLYWEDIYA